MGSEVARFREQQALEAQAAQHGLCGFAAGYSRHEFIEMRMNREAEHLTALMQHGSLAQVEAAIERMQADIDLMEQAQRCPTSLPGQTPQQKGGN